MSIEAMKAARDYIRDVPPDAFFGALARGTSVLAKLNEAIAAAEKVQHPDDEGAALTVAYLHGHGKGKDSVQPVLAEKDALLRQALEVLEAYSKSGYVRHEHPKKYAAGDAVAKAIRANLGIAS